MSRSAERCDAIAPRPAASTAAAIACSGVTWRTGHAGDAWVEWDEQPGFNSPVPRRSRHPGSSGGLDSVMSP